MVVLPMFAVNLWFTWFVCMRVLICGVRRCLCVLPIVQFFILILSWIYVKVASLFLHYSGYFRMHRHPVSYVLTHIHTS